MGIKSYLERVYAYLNRYNINTLLIFTLLALAYLSSYQTYKIIWKGGSATGPNPSEAMSWMLLDLAIFLSLLILVARNIIKKWLGNKENKGGSRLQNRIILMFCLSSAIPTILVSIFSSYFFNFGIESWFDKKIQAVLDQSVQVAESYIVEHKTRLKDASFSIADDLNGMYYDLMHNQILFNKILDGQSEMRSLHEVIVFQKNTNAVIAKSSLSFSLAFISIPQYLIERADKGEAVEIDSDPTKIRMLIKLHDNDAYLLIGRLVDQKIMDHIDQTKGAAEEYIRLKKIITKMQIKFSGIFILVAMIILVLVIICGIIFAAYIVMPIKNLVLATESVKDGDFSVRLKEGPENDEISILSMAFNRMVQQIDRQQKDLIIAQRALAWSDVARRVAHEIKNPLTPIQLSAERLLKKFTPTNVDRDEFKKCIETIIRRTQDIEKIVSEFVQFAKMPAPSFEFVNIVKLISDIVDSHKIINDKITFFFESSIDRLEIMCDVTQISQVMGNLIKNAQEAVELVQDKKIKTEISMEGECLIIQVTDSGKGFPVELMDKISEPYFTTRSKGTGLGLAIVKKITQDHCGTMEISNSPGGRVKLAFNIIDLGKKSLKSPNK
jgi:two-component system nitrogen regulation sensor histidine kinase NtrY